MFLYSTYINRYAELFQKPDKLIEHRVGGDRLLLWKSSLEMIQDYPALGVGLNNFNKVYLENNYIDPMAQESNLKSPHNIFLHYAVEIGLAGALVFVLILAYQLVYLKEYLENKLVLAYFLAIIGMIVHGLVDYIFLNGAYYKLYWLSFAVIINELFNKRTKGDMYLK